MTGFTPRVAVRIHEIVLGKDSCKLELLPAEVVYVSHIHKKYLNIEIIDFKKSCYYVLQLLFIDTVGK